MLLRSRIHYQHYKSERSLLGSKRRDDDGILKTMNIKDSMVVVLSDVFKFAIIEIMLSAFKNSQDEEPDLHIPKMIALNSLTMNMLVTKDWSQDECIERLCKAIKPISVK